VDAEVATYRVRRDPARVEDLGTTTETVSRAEYEALVAQSCFLPDP
jgi:hypothetical protein